MTDRIVDVVREKYAAVAKSGLTNENAGVRSVAEAFGYSEEELASIPAAANMGLSCGNPTATANLRPGEVVVDLGCGGGLDVFLAAQKVGPTGKAIGIDMTPAMIERAQKNAQETGVENVAFHLASIDRLPLADGSVDVVISNCVINLAPDKRAVFREAFRVLKPGGRMAVSDIALKKPLPLELAKDIEAYVGCIAGAELIETYRRQLLEAGFTQVQVVDSHADLNSYSKVENQSGCCSPAMEAASAAQATSCCKAPSQGLTVMGAGCCGGGGEAKPDSTVHGGLSELLQRHNVNDFAASVKVFAVKG